MGEIEEIGKRLAYVEAKALVDTLAEEQTEADVKTLRDTLVKVEA